MTEYKMTQQDVQGDWVAVEGAAAREMELVQPAGDGWTLHFFRNSPDQVVAVWAREKRSAPIANAYSQAKEHRGG